MSISCSIRASSTASVAETSCSKDFCCKGNILACCSINVTEIYAGMRPAEEPRTTELLKSLKFYPVTWDVARLAGELKYEHARKGIALATTDVTVAAVAIHHQLPLLTDNTKHYPMKEINLYPLPQRLF